MAEKSNINSMVKYDGMNNYKAADLLHRAAEALGEHEAAGIMHYCAMNLSITTDCNEALVTENRELRRQLGEDI